MPSMPSGALRSFQFRSLQVPGVEHAIFTRHGGVSPVPWQSLNVGGLVGDDPACVAANRLRMFDALHRPAESLASVWQVHSDRVIVIDAPSNGRESEKADGMVTDRPGVTLMMRFADCVPILAFDPARRVLGMAHAGWKGTLARIASRLVETLHQAYGTQGQNLLVGIGPSIAAHHYPVGPEVVQQVVDTFGQRGEAFLEARDGEVRFDLWAANRWLLEVAGVTQIEISGICTACHTEDWYSHRGEAGRTGRFGALMHLASPNE
jgi:YfiH family protein